MIGALMAAGIQKLDEDKLALPRWQMIFVILGVIVSWLHGCAYVLWLWASSATITVPKL